MKCGRVTGSDETKPGAVITGCITWALKRTRTRTMPCEVCVTTAERSLRCSAPASKCIQLTTGSNPILFLGTGFVIILILGWVPKVPDILARLHSGRKIGKPTSISNPEGYLQGLCGSPARDGQLHSFADFLDFFFGLCCVSFHSVIQFTTHFLLAHHRFFLFSYGLALCEEAPRGGHSWIEAELQWPPCGPSGAVCCALFTANDILGQVSDF